MNAGIPGLVLFLALTAGVTAATVRDAAPDPRQAVRDAEPGAIPRVVVAAKRFQALAEDCETAPARVVVTAHRQGAG